MSWLYCGKKMTIKLHKLPERTFHTVFFTRGKFLSSGIAIACICASVCLSVCLSDCQPRICPRDSSFPIQAKIARFRPEVQNTLLKILIVLGSDWPWKSRSNLTWKVKISLCPFYPLGWITNHQSKHIIATWTAPRSRLLHSLHHLHIIIYLDRFTALTVSHSQPSARMLI